MASYLICKDATLPDPPSMDTCATKEWVEVPVTLSMLTEQQVADLTGATALVFAVAFAWRFLREFILNRR